MTTRAIEPVSAYLKSLPIACLQVFSFTALTGLAAHAKFFLPFTPVPITLQTLVVILSGAVLGSQKGALSQGLIFVLAAVGAPVLSQTGALWGPTGGYVLGFILASFVTGKMKEQGLLKRSPFLTLNLWLFVASMFVFLPGVLWLKTSLGISISKALTLGFYPFIVGDIVKTILAASFVRARARLSR